MPFFQRFSVAGLLNFIIVFDMNSVFDLDCVFECIVAIFVLKNYVFLKGRPWMGMEFVFGAHFYKAFLGL